MESEYEQPPEWTHQEPNGARWGVQQYGLHGTLWRTVETVTKAGQYIHHNNAFASRESALSAIRRRFGEE